MSIVTDLIPTQYSLIQIGLQLAGFINRELAAFEAATGLTKYVPPEEPGP